MSSTEPFHVLIVGGGIVGLIIAQGCQRNGISYTVYEQDGSSSRRQGWSVTLHWCLKALDRVLGEEMMQEVKTAVVDRTLANDAGNILFLNAATGDVKYKVPPSKNRLRLHRKKFMEVLSRDLDIRWGRKIKSIEDLPGQSGVKATFEDGSSAQGSLLIGADGNKSVVRKHLLPQSHQLYRLPVNVIGVIRHLTPEQAAPIRALDPLLFQALDPETGNYLWYSVQDTHEESDGRISVDAQVLVSWLVRAQLVDAIPTSNSERIALMKKRVANFAESLRSIVTNIPDDAETITLRLCDFVPPLEGWGDTGGRITLAGDAAHAMTMYRGEGANHGILDAALLVDQLKRITSGKTTQENALLSYEIEMRERASRGVLLSRQAALNAHDWKSVNENSPLIGARVLPATAMNN